MPTFVQDCPRCNANRMTFDVIADVRVGKLYNWQQVFEVYAVCRRCGHPSQMRLLLENIRREDEFEASGSLMKQKGDLAEAFRFDRFVTVADAASKPAPPDLPEDISAAFEEGARCLAIGCANAAGAMFRLALDLATKRLLPPVEIEGGPSKHDRRNLAPRLRWLFDQGGLPRDLRDLSKAVKETGDDGAHEGSLDAAEAEDIYDFAYARLDRMYSEPARLAAAAKRREERLAKRDNPAKAARA